MHVLNNLSGGNMLSLHCQSKHGDRDLGMHDLRVGAEFSWTFNAHFWGTKHYGCYMRTNQAQATVDVFPGPGGLWLDLCDCFWTDVCDCIWTAKDDGIYLRNVPRNRDEFSLAWEYQQ